MDRGDEALMGQVLLKDNENVIPAQTGIQSDGRGLDSHFRGNDGTVEELSEKREVIHWMRLENTFI